MRTVVRYSEAFKLRLVEDVAGGKYKSLDEAGRRNGIRGSATVARRVKQYGREDILPKRIKMETTGEIDEMKAARRRIADQWKERYPSRPLAHSTIYRAIARRVLKKGYPTKKHLMRHGKGRGQHSSPTIKPGYTKHERPPDAENRERLGDIEGDTVYGKGYVVTMVDRKSRMLYAKKCENHNSAHRGNGDKREHKWVSPFLPAQGDWLRAGFGRVFSEDCFLEKQPSAQMLGGLSPVQFVSAMCCT
jgi:transposase-like protein